MGYIFYLMGKSSSGKDTIYQELLKSLPLHPIVLYTTRPMRSGEQNGKDYYFVDDDYVTSQRNAGKVIESRVYQTVHGLWTYCTIDDGAIDLQHFHYLGIGTLVSYMQIQKYFGSNQVIPLYIDTEDGVRLQRALKRERMQAEPRYQEMCRRFLADCEDYSLEKIRAASITKIYRNDNSLDTCINEIAQHIIEMTGGVHEYKICTD